MFRVGLGLFFFLFSQPSWGFHVLIDPGHGGRDWGASSGPYLESHITLKVSQALKQLLDKDQGFTASLSRQSDRFISLSHRVLMRNKENIDIFVSIHVNSSQDSTIYGGEVYFANQLPLDGDALVLGSREVFGGASAADPMTIHNQESFRSPEVTSIIRDLKRNNNLFLSGELSKTILQSWKVPNTRIRHIQQAPFFVLSNAHIPAVLVELGFITHHKEAQLLNQESHQMSLAHSIYTGLKNYKHNF